MTQKDTLKDRIFFSYFFKRKGLSAPILKQSLVLMHPLWQKVFSGCTHFAAKFSLDTPILTKSFLWIHPSWPKVFSGCTHFGKQFSLDAPILSVHGRSENSPPQIPQQQQEEEQHFAADKKVINKWDLPFFSDDPPHPDSVHVRRHLAHQVSAHDGKHWWRGRETGLFCSRIKWWTYLP